MKLFHFEILSWKDLIEELKDSSIYKDVLSKFTDAELIDVKNIEKEELDDWFNKNIRQSQRAWI